ncbi:glycosyltransferase family 1 protein [Siculibacillus lacustris]|uniref:Glycosyltransferase family 1 protein n=1 Tax=Siculibacillus lacustris TaxID=1549641 RepID=A0A4Q9VDZ9_9HYPH|nr:glycosyltransferase family 4 protein [Siculibacillus lacustris]TBW32969.1 glycosyltransferase family 1 protein [Siculibacillus lacustris]
MQSRLPIISIIDPLGKHGGHHYFVDGTARGLAAAGHEVHVYVTEFTGVTPGRPFEERVTFGSLYSSEPAAIRAVRYFVGLAKALWWARRAGTEVVCLHAFSHDLREVAAIWGARLLGMKVALTVHDIESFGSSSSGWVRDLALAGASGLIFLNHYSKETFERLSGSADRRSAIVPHGHYVDYFPHPPSRDDARSRLGLEPDECVFLFFGNPREEKGLDLLISALGPLAGRPGWRLMTAGKMKPPQEAAMRELVASVGIADRVSIHAYHVPDEETVYYYRAADLVVIPYRRIYESGVTIMAMGNARAVLVSDLPPLTEKVVPGETGFVFACGDEAALTAALSEALDQQAGLDGFGAEGRRRIMASRDWGTVGVTLSAFAVSLCR